MRHPQSNKITKGELVNKETPSIIKQKLKEKKPESTWRELRWRRLKLQRVCKSSGMLISLFFFLSYTSIPPLLLSISFNNFCFYVCFSLYATTFVLLMMEFSSSLIRTSMWNSNSYRGELLCEGFRSSDFSSECEDGVLWQLNILG